MDTVNPYQSPKEKMGPNPERWLDRERQPEAPPKKGSCLFAILWSILGAIIGVFVGLVISMYFSNAYAEKLRAGNPGKPLCGMFVFAFLGMGFFGGAFLGGIAGTLLYAFTLFRKKNNWK